MEKKRKSVSFLTSFVNQMTPCGLTTASFLETLWATVFLAGVNDFNICILVIWNVVCSIFVNPFPKQQQTLKLQSELSVIYRTNDSLPASLWSDELQFSHLFVTVQMTLRISAPAHYKPELNYTTICPCICFKCTLNSVWNPFSPMSRSLTAFKSDFNRNSSCSSGETGVLQNWGTSVGSSCGWSNSV